MNGEEAYSYNGNAKRADELRQKLYDKLSAIIRFEMTGNPNFVKEQTALLVRDASTLLVGLSQKKEGEYLSVDVDNLITAIYCNIKMLEVFFSKNLDKAAFEAISKLKLQ